MKLEYLIDNKKVSINVNNPKFFSGKDEVLSKKYDDITSNTEWFGEGFLISDFKLILMIFTSFGVRLRAGSSKIP